MKGFPMPTTGTGKSGVSPEILAQVERAIRERADDKHIILVAEESFDGPDDDTLRRVLAGLHRGDQHPDAPIVMPDSAKVEWASLDPGQLPARNRLPRAEQGR